jgi:phosphoserine phosphatase RsbU/P
MKSFSIRWKLSLALVGLSLGLVSVYIVIASGTFESDKISYVFESQQNELEAVAKSWEAIVSQSLFLGRSVLSTFQAEKGEFSENGKKLFSGQKTIKALQVVDGKTLGVLATIAPEMFSGLPPVTRDNNPAPGEIRITHKIGNEFLIETTNSVEDAVRIRLLIELPEIFPKWKETDFFLVNQGKIAIATGADPARYSDLIADIGRDRSERTQIKAFRGYDFLLTNLPLRVGDFHLVALASKSVALKALNTLYDRSLIFILFSSFVTVLLALLLSGGLTKTLARLTDAAAQISRGDFSQVIPVSSGDEIGILSAAFGRMSKEIVRLLEETRDKARMESELKVARLVQTTLFPEEIAFDWAEYEIFGKITTATECGGDWWYHFENEDQLTICVADATGHGTPAALMTSASRAAFNIFEKSKMSLLEIAQAWSATVASCSGKKIFMTALIVRFDKKTGQVRLLSASHELPFRFKKQDDGYTKVETLDLELSSMLGDDKKPEWIENSMQLDPGEILVLYTDGVYANKTAEGKEITEERLARMLGKQLKVEVKPEVLVNEIIKQLAGGGAIENLADDMTMVAIRRRV